MKHCLLLNLRCILLFLHVSAQKSRSSLISNLKYVDVFHQHLKILDAIIKRGSYDLQNRSDSSVRYMERVTHIKAHWSGDYVGLKPFTWEDLGLWKTWYKNIGSKRIGMII